MPRPLLILCLGNEIIADDRFGFEVAERLKQGEEVSRADVIFAPVAGFQLIDLLAERKAALIVDTIRTGNAAPGTLHEFPAGTLTPSKNLTTSHQISLPTALELGKKLGAAMPETVDVLAVEALDLETLVECLTPPVQSAVEPAMEYIRRWVERKSVTEADHAN